MSKKRKKYTRDFNIHPSWNKDKKHSKETKLKMSIAKKGCIPWNKGKKMPEETKLKISKSRMGIPAWNKGFRYPEDVKRILRKIAKELRAK